MKTKITFLFTVIIVVFFTSTISFSQNSSYEIATWEGFRTAAVTFTFDDNCANQFSAAVPIFDKYGYKASFYPVINWSPNWTTLKNLANNGHEIGSHSVTHPSGAMTESEMSSSKNTVNQNVPGFDCNTITYPNCVVPTESTCAKYYIGGRICDGQVANTTPSNYFRIGSIICGSQGSCNSLANFQTQFTSAKNKKGWAVFLIHEVNNGSGYSPLQSSIIESALSYLKQNDNDYWVTTFRNAILYSKERDAAKINELTNTASGITMTITDNLDNAVYKYPLSVRRTLPAGWTNVTAIQGGKTIEASIKSGYIYFSAVPDGGTVSLTSGTPISGFTVSTSVSPASSGGTVNFSPVPPANGRYNEGTIVTLTAVVPASWKFDSWSGDVTGTQSPLTITMNADKNITAKFVPTVDGTTNLVKDGNFPGNSLTTNWALQAYGGSAATANVNGGKATINITATGTEMYQPQLVQKNIALEQGMKYRLTFKASSAAASRVINVMLQQSSGDYIMYASEDFNLTSTEQTFTLEFEMTNPSDPNTQLAFNIGGTGNGATQNVTISDVKLIYITPDSETTGNDKISAEVSTESDLRVNVLPNSAVNVNFTAANDGETELRLYSLSGSLIASNKLYTFAGKNYSHTFDQGKLPGGFYVVWMNSNGNVEQTKVVVPK